MRFLKAVLTLSILTMPSAAQTVINGSRTLLGNWDASGASTTKPAKSGTTLPATCGIGEMFFKTNATPGANIYLCTATNTWTAAAGGGGGGSGTVTNTGGTLTMDQPVFGAGGSDSKIGTKAGTGTQVVMSQSPTIVTPTIADLTNMAHGHTNTAGGGQLGIAAHSAASLSGNGTKLVTTSGTLTSGDCAKFDANGNIVDNGSGCGAGAANYRQSFTGSTSVSMTHNLNSFGVVVACYDNATPAAWILPKSATLTDANTVTVTFAASQSGACVVNSTGGGPSYLAGSSSLGFGAIAQAACSQLTFTLTGAAAGDPIAPGWPGTLESGLVGNMYVSATNTVTVRLCNLSGGSVTPANQLFKATILK